MKFKMNGFTLLEVMLSMVMFTVLAIGAMNAMPMVKRGSVTRMDHTQAMLILEQRMAEIRRDYADQGMIPVVTPTVMLRDGLQANLAVQVEMHDGVNWVADDTNVRVGLRRVQLTVAWTNSSNVPETVELNGLLFHG